MGKYIRHGIGILVTALVGALLPLLGIDPTLLSEEQATIVNNFTAAFETFLYLLLTFIWYPLLEKFLKRFPALDKEGWIDWLWLKHEKVSPSADTKVLQERARIK